MDRGQSLTGRIAVPFVDLGPVHRPLKESILAELSSLIDENAFVNGSHVGEFERAYASYIGTKYCVGVSSGLDALRLGLLAAGIEPGGEVMVPANTFIATFEAVTQAGGRPIPVDVTERDYNIDVDAVEEAVGPRTGFILPVHLFGQLADVRRLHEIAARRGLQIVEDACQAHGASRDGLRAGAIGIAGAFSFYPGKNLGAMGDAGALTTDDADLAARVKALREHGQTAKYHHEAPGYTARLDTVQALVLLAKLPHLDSWNEQRRWTARFYNDALENVGDLRLPPVPPGSEPVWHLYVVRTTYRQALETFLNDRRVTTGRHYPEPVHLAPAYASLGYTRASFPVTETLAEELLSLPIYPGITEEQLGSVVENIRAFFKRAK